MTTTILVIDDDPFINHLVAAAWPEASIIAAFDGVTALEMIRQRNSEQSAFHLIVLDITLKEMSGYEICARIRDLTETTPILPFTSLDVDTLPHLKRFMGELGCAPPLRKGVPPNTLAARLIDAIHMTPVIQYSAALEQLQQAAADLEWRLKHATDVPQVLIIASLLLDRLSLYLILEHSNVRVRTCEGGPLQAQQLIARNPAFGTIIAPAHEAAAILPVTESIHIPTLFVARSPREGLMFLHEHHPFQNFTSSPIGLVVGTDTITTTVSDALRTMKAGHTYIDPLLQTEPRTRLDRATTYLQRKYPDLEIHISVTELEFLLLEAADKEEEEMAEKLKKNQTAIYKLRSRLRQKFGVTAASLRRLAREITYDLLSDTG